MSVTGVAPERMGSSLFNSDYDPAFVWYFQSGAGFIRRQAFDHFFHQSSSSIVWKLIEHLPRRLRSSFEHDFCKAPRRWIACIKGFYAVFYARKSSFLYMLQNILLHGETEWWWRAHILAEHGAHRTNTADLSGRVLKFAPNSQYRPATDLQDPMQFPHRFQSIWRELDTLLAYH